jgi:hypothetical protein
MAQSRKRSKPRVVREPMQVYLTPDESSLLARLAKEEGISKAEVLRRGVRSYAREQGAESPMLRLVREVATDTAPEGVAADHDTVLAEIYRGESSRKKRR